MKQISQLQTFSRTSVKYTESRGARIPAAATRFRQEMGKIPRILMGEINKSVFFRFLVMIDQTADAPVRDATKHHALWAPEAGLHYIYTQDLFIILIL